MLSPGSGRGGLVGHPEIAAAEKGGEFARGLERGRKATLALFEKLHADARFATAFAPELDIVVFAPRAASVSETSVLTRKMFEAAAKRGLHLAVAELPIRFLGGESEGDEARP